MMLWSSPNQLGASRRSAPSFGTDSKVWAQNEPKEVCLRRIGRSIFGILHEWGIEIGLKSQETVKAMKPPTTKKELQKLIGKINFVRRFISNLSRRIEPFMGLVKIKPMMSFAGGQNSSKLLIKSRNICQSLQCWFLLSKIGRFTCTYPWVTLPLLRC